MKDGKKEQLELFLKDETYAFIKDIFGYFFNGRVLEIFENKFLFMDDVLGKIEINFSDVVKVAHSTRNKGVGE